MMNEMPNGDDAIIKKIFTLLLKHIYFSLGFYTLYIPILPIVHISIKKIDLNIKRTLEDA